MNKRSATIAALWLVMAGTGHAQPQPHPLQTGLEAVLFACEQWVLEPITWVDSIEAFPAAIGLEGVLRSDGSVSQASLPPPAYRRNNHYWRIVAETSGYVLVVSDTLPICHLTGGGEVDLQPHVEAVLGSEAFNARWSKVSTQTRGDIVSDEFRNIEYPKLTIVISRPNHAGGRTDRVQIVATAGYDLGQTTGTPE